jgi:hypothetical protein
MLNPMSALAFTLLARATADDSQATSLHPSLIVISKPSSSQRHQPTSKEP